MSPALSVRSGRPFLDVNRRTLYDVDKFFRRMGVTRHLGIRGDTHVRDDDLDVLCKRRRGPYDFDRAVTLWRLGLICAGKKESGDKAR